VAIVTGVGLWKLKAWAWWPVFVNSSLIASSLSILLALAWYEGRASEYDAVVALFIAFPTALAAYIWSNPIRSVFSGHYASRRETPPDTLLGLGLVTLSLVGLAGTMVGGSSGEQLTITVSSFDSAPVAFEGEIRAYDVATLGPSKKKESISGTTPKTFKFRAPENYIVYIEVKRLGASGSLAINVEGCPTTVDKLEVEDGGAEVTCWMMSDTP
jgi:hypothetical protein